MQTVIDLLEARLRYYITHRNADTDLPTYKADFTKALSILRSYPGAVKDEAEPAEPLPTIYVGLDSTGSPYWSRSSIGSEIAPDYVATAARKLIANPDERDMHDVRDLDAALARWQSSKVATGVKPVFRTKEETEKLDGMFNEATPHFPTGNAGDEPIAPEFTPPEMDEDPRFLKLLVLALQSRLEAMSDDLQGLSAETDAIDTFNSLFPKP